MYDVTIFGAGIIGSLMARELSKYKLDILLLEKEVDVSMGSTKANSGIVHGGYAENHSTLKGRLCHLGRMEFDSLDRELGFGFEKIGSLVIGTQESDLEILEELRQNGLKNGLVDLEIIDGKKAKEIEPSIGVDVKYALYCKGAGVCSPFEFAIAAAENAVVNGVELSLQSKVVAIADRKSYYEVTIDKNGKQELIQTRYLINAAGIHSDEISNMVGNAGFSIKPRSGEYLIFKRKNQPLVNTVIFSVPTKMGKGILVTKTIHDNLLIGPDALDEQKESVNKSTHLDRLIKVYKEAKQIVPELDEKEVIRNFSGIRAVADSGDFVIEISFPRFLNLAGIQSPGLTSSPAIVKMGIDLLREEGLSLETNPGFNPYRKRISPKIPLFDEQTAKKMLLDPSDDGLICRCEQITRGVVKDAISRRLPIATIDGVKRRTRCSTGACQGTSGCRERTKALFESFGMDLDIEQDYIRSGESRVSKKEFLAGLKEFDKNN